MRNSEWLTKWACGKRSALQMLINELTSQVRTGTNLFRL
jgi:hypothetical protein